MTARMPPLLGVLVKLRCWRVFASGRLGEGYGRREEGGKRLLGRTCEKEETRSRLLLVNTATSKRNQRRKGILILQEGCTSGVYEERESKSTLEKGIRDGVV